MTPDDAKTKWCPFVRISTAMSGTSNVLTVGNRGGSSQSTTPDININCLADGCMAWRWFGDTEGYCGLAGQTTG